MNKQKRMLSQLVKSARIVASVILAGLVGLLIHLNSKTDIGSALGVFYLAVLATIFAVVWIALEIKVYLKK